MKEPGEGAALEPIQTLLHGIADVAEKGITRRFKARCKRTEWRWMQVAGQHARSAAGRDWRIAILKNDVRTRLRQETTRCCMAHGQQL